MVRHPLDRLGTSVLPGQEEWAPVSASDLSLVEIYSATLEQLRSARSPEERSRALLAYGLKCVLVPDLAREGASQVTGEGFVALVFGSPTSNRLRAEIEFSAEHPRLVVTFEGTGPERDVGRDPTGAIHRFLSTMTVVEAEWRRQPKAPMPMRRCDKVLGGSSKAKEPGSGFLRWGPQHGRCDLQTRCPIGHLV